MAMPSDSKNVRPWRALTPPRLVRVLGLLAAAAVGAGCRGGEPDQALPQTGFPGQVTAGGHTSGELLARNSRDGGSNGAQGTPGIPGGSGGNTGGAAMGGDGNSGESGKAGGSGGGERSGESGESGNAGEDSAQKAAREKQAAAEREKAQLAAAMDRVAAHWRERAATDPSIGNDTAPSGVKQGLAEDVPRTEKHGTAPPSEDVKQPGTPDDSGATVPSDAYKQAD